MADLIQLINEYRVAVSTKDCEEALIAVAALVNPSIYLYFLGHAGSDAEAQDLRSIAVEDILRGLKKFEGETSREAWAWCYAIASRKLAKHFEQKKSSRTVFEEPDVLEKLINASEVSNPFEGESERIDVQDALQTLKTSDPNCFRVLWDHFIVGKDYGELAAIMEKTSDAVRMQITRCLEKIEPLLN